MCSPLNYIPLSETHLEACAALWADPEVIRYTNILTPCSYAESKTRLSQLLQAQASLSFPSIFAIQKDGRFCGIVGCLAIEGMPSSFGLFYQLQRADWGRGIGFQCAAWLLAYLHKTLGAFTLYADVVRENTASRRILEKLRFRLIGRESVPNSTRVIFTYQFQAGAETPQQP